MKRFQFSLDRVLEWRQSQLAVAENQLRVLEQEKQNIGLSLSAVKADLNQAGEEIRRSASITGPELSAVAEYRASCETQRCKLADKFTELRREVEQQRALLIKMRRDCRLLETLREQRRAEWKVDFERHQDQLSAEVHQALRYLSGREALQGAETLHGWRRKSA